MPHNWEKDTITHRAPPNKWRCSVCGVSAYQAVKPSPEREVLMTTGYNTNGIPVLDFMECEKALVYCIHGE